jgi:hypothetical protein
MQGIHVIKKTIDVIRAGNYEIAVEILENYMKEAALGGSQNSTATPAQQTHENSIKVKCVSCGKEPEPNKSKSNKNWTSFDIKPCKHCGGQVKMCLGNKPKAGVV